MPHRKKVSYFVGLLGLLAACETLGPPDPLPANAQSISAPAEEYLGWWAATEACSGIEGRFAEVSWYIVPGALTIDTPEGPKVGMWSHSSEGVRIVLAGAYADNELVVRHEMLHALLDRTGHPKEYFEHRCHLTWDTWGAGSNGG
jgi:hypothetical protein